MVADGGALIGLDLPYQGSKSFSGKLSDSPLPWPHLHGHRPETHGHAVLLDAVALLRTLSSSAWTPRSSVAVTSAVVTTIALSSS